MTVFEAYITNLGKYSEGQLVGETLKFPATTEEVQSLLKNIGVDGVRYEEFFITAFDGDVMGLYDYLTEYENLDELNHLAHLISELDSDEIETLEAVLNKGDHMRSSKPSCWKTAEALRWGIILPHPRPMSHGLAMMARTASGSMNGGITAATVPLWNRTLRRGCRSTSAFTMSVSGRPRLPAFTSIILPSAPWTLGHSPSRPTTPRMRSSTTISVSRLKMGLFWRGDI